MNKTLLKKPSHPKPEVKNRLEKERQDHTHSDDELFIGSVLCGDLSFATKNNDKNKEGFYKRFSLIPTKPL